MDLYLEVIPGVPALAAGAALLGAPLMHDFASISLSDLLTPWEIIAKRLEAGGPGGFCHRPLQPQEQEAGLAAGRGAGPAAALQRPGTPVGIVTRAMRQGQEVMITTLQDLLEHPVDMQTIVIVGNSQTYAYGPYMVTPRGYLGKYQAAEDGRGGGQ